MKHSIAFIVPFCLVASAWAWDWPASTDIVVPANTTASVTADDVEKLAAAKTLTIGAGSYVYFDHGATPLVLSAAVSGPGTSYMWLRNSAYVVFAGNNTNFLGTTYGRSASTLVVSNRFGLGCAQTKTVNFSEANLLFGGAGLTNDVPIKINVLSTIKRLQVDPAEGTFVQNGDFTDWNTYANLVLGNAIFNGNYYQDNGSPGFVSDSTDRDLVFNAPFISTSSSGWAYGDSKVSGRMHFNASGNAWKSFRIAHGNDVRIICGAANALPASSFFTIRYRAARSMNSSIDLGGYDQSVLDIRPDYQLENATQFYEIKSDKPATLTLTQTSESVYYSALKFTGQAGLHYAGAGTLQIYNALSTSTGPLTVSSGTVEFGVYKSGWTGGGWSGNEINVTGGKLLISSPRGLQNGKAVVTISGGGTLEVASGVTVVVKKLVTSGGTFETGGDYTVADLTGLGVTGLAGLGSIIVGDVYADAEDGKDTNDGRTPQTAKQSLAAALALARAPGVFVRLAEGTYSNETMTVSDVNYRGIVPEGVTVVGAGREKTIIKGNKVKEEPIQCVKLGANARISDVTLCESYGAAVSAPTLGLEKSTAYIVDCVISNNYAWQGAAGNGGSYLRCLIAKNDSETNTSGLWTPDNVFGCVFWYGGMVNDVVEAATVANCTFISDPSLKNRQPLFRGSGNCNAYNCIIDRSYSSKVTYKNCLFTEKAEGDPKESGSTYTDCLYAKGRETEFDADFRPVYGHNDAIDAGSRADYERVVKSVFGEEDLKKDFAGGQRVYNALIDIGAGEYDWRPSFSAALNAKNVSVTKATEDVTLAAGKVALTAGDTLSFTLLRQAPAKPVEVGFVVAGTGFVKAYANGSLIGTFASGSQVLRYTPASANDALTFVSEGGATAVIDPVERLSGLMLLLR